MAIRRWLGERVGLIALFSKLSRVEVSGRDPALYLASALLFLFLLEVASGILLLLPYWPDAEHAHASIVTIMGRVPYGSLVRGVHAWASQFLVLTLIAHPFVLLLRRRYVPPGELVWLSSFVLVVIGIGLAFTGAILPWNESAYSQALVSSELAGHMPWIGEGLKYFMRGGENVNNWTLHHAYGFHTGVLPAVATFWITLHAVLWVRRAQLSTAPSLEAKIFIYPDLIVRLSAVCVFLLVLVISLATFSEPATGTAAQWTAPTSAAARPPWYFVMIHQLLKAVPTRLVGVDGASFVMGALTLLGVVAAALPLLDPRGSKLTVYSGLLLLVLYVWLTAYAFV